MWLEVEETEDCMMDAMYQELGYGWRRYRRQYLNVGNSLPRLVNQNIRGL